MTCGLQRRPGRGRASPQAGFSLVEMIVVLCLVCILAVIANNHLSISGQRRTLLHCRDNLGKIYIALNLYQNDNKGLYPLVPGASNPSQPLSLLVPTSTTTTEIFLCPGARGEPLPEGEPFAGRKISYAYYMGRTTNEDANVILATDAQVDIAPKKAGQPLFSPDGHAPANNHGKIGGNLVSRAGEITDSGPAAARDLGFPPTVRLLNPQ